MRAGPNKYGVAALVVLALALAWAYHTPRAKYIRAQRLKIPVDTLCIEEPLDTLSFLICPYDELIQSEAVKIGWDWRLLAALVYEESKFDPSAKSSRGACGLMQMMPVTSERFGATDPFDPAQSIAAGVGYIDFLQQKYSSRTSDPDELTKFTLAAYNAGAERLADFFRYAEAHELPCSTWEDIKAFLPDFADESILDDESVRYGTFKAEETINFVNKVLATYADYCIRY